MINKMDGCQIVPQPMGLVAILGAWNYPIQLTLVPLVGALSAGNSVVIKPSELAPATAQLLADTLPKYFPDGTVSVINGGVEETTVLLRSKFDKILYTGNGRVGKIILKVDLCLTRRVSLRSR